MLSLKELNIFYGDAQAVRDLSITVEEGALAALLGANGAGKSTTLQAIVGLTRLRSGSIEFMGEKLNDLPPEDIVERGISLVPEGRWLFAKMTVAENLRMGGYPSRARKNAAESVEHVLKLFPVLKSHYQLSAASLSGGEQQMLAIGRALMSKPRLLMLDEPSLGLAPLVVETVFEVIQRLHESGVTILLVEQNVRESLKLAQQAFVIKTGSLTLSGKGAELLENPEVQRAFLGIGKDLS
ncbi:ABC transporter ATP-binding protein [Thermodesulfobacteriota bacterium]